MITLKCRDLAYKHIDQILNTQESLTSSWRRKKFLKGCLFIFVFDGVEIILRFG